LVEMGNMAERKRRRGRGPGRGPFLTVSFPIPLLREVEKIVDERGY